MAEQALKELKEIIASITGLEVEEINDNDDLVADIGVDSLKVIELVTGIERKYKVRVKDSQLANVKTVLDAAKILEDLGVYKVG